MAQSTALMSKKDQVKAIAAQGELKALKASKSKKSKNGGSRRPRPSIFGWLAFLVAPITYFLAGLPGFTQGASASGDLQTRLRRGMSALLMAYTGFTFDGRFFAKALLFGWAPIALTYVIRKTKVNRLAPRGVPVIF